MELLETIIAKARLNAETRNIQESNQESNQNKEQKRKGLEFMAIRHNVVDRKRKLRVCKEVTPSEYYLIEEIELGTIGARNPKGRICSKTEFQISWLGMNLGLLPNKVYAQLKSLESKGLILREKTQHRGVELIGLHPTEFGQILIDQEHEKEKKRHLRLVENF